jgi:ABC-type multidrug transport system ATPase subunit
MKPSILGKPVPALRAVGLAKSFGKVEAVRGVDLELRRGEIYGFLGRNGAGKTTTIRMILGLVRPSSGAVELFGLPLAGRREESLSRVGYLVEGASAYPNLTVRENLELQRRLMGAARGRVDEAIALLGLGPLADRKADKLSLGNKQRLSIARAVLNSPELLILDEPANGLDPAGIIEMRELMRNLAREKGSAILMSSHILAEVEQLADRIGIIHEGRVVEELDREELHSKGRRFIDLRVTASGRAAPEAAELILREKLAISEVKRREDGALRIPDSGSSAPAVARELVAAGLELEMLLPVEEGLETRFMRLTGGEE